MKETLRQPRNLLRLMMLSGAILVAACGSDEEAITDSEPSTANQVTIETKYFPNGARLISYSNDNGQFADRFQHCDGLDLTEQTELFGPRYDGASGNAIVRSVGHPACADGVLTPEDFELQSVNP